MASDGKTFVSTNPAILSDEIGEFPLSTKDDVHSLLKGARDAFKWASTPAPTRGQVIGNMGRLLMDHEEIVRLQAREIGKTLKVMWRSSKAIDMFVLPVRGKKAIRSNSKF